MAKRRKTRQSTKKAAAVEESAPVVEINEDDTQDSSLQEEDEISSEQNNAIEQESENKSSAEPLIKNEDTSMEPVKQENVETKHDGDQINQDNDEVKQETIDIKQGITSKENEPDEEPMETTLTENESRTEKTMPDPEQEMKTTTTEETSNDKVDVADDETNNTKDTNVEESGSDKTPAESDQMQAEEAELTDTETKHKDESELSGIAESKSGTIEQMETEEKPEDDKQAEESNEQENEERSEFEKEEDAIPAGPTVEKLPSSPLCYDDETEEIPIDPEEDGEVNIGSESSEFLKYWRAVLENPQDFTNWTYLLQLVEQENKPPLARRAYNGFFKRYPLCYGYWKKFSEMEKRHGNFVRAQRILERGVRAIPLSIDLWVHMVDFYVNHYKGPDAGREKVKTVFERAIKAAGAEFRSEKLWNKYIHWEKSNKDWSAVINIYERVLKVPTQHYAIFSKDYKDFVMSRSPKELLSYQEFEETLEKVRDEAEALEKDKKNGEGTEIEEDVDDDAPPGVESNDRGKPPNEKELKAISEKIIASKKKMFDETEASVTKIWTFEEGIKRPYFHVKALERTQIKNWRDYLESEIGRQENSERIILLFERCLIACALYEDFWLKYARYLMKIDIARVRDVYKRACQIHLPKKPNIHLHWATFEELGGHHDAAAKILEDLEKSLPNLVMIKLRRVAIQRRAGNIQAAEDILKSYVSATEKGNDQCFYVRKYAWFLVKVSNKVDVARQVMKDAIEANPDLVQLYKDLVGLEFTHGNEDQVIEACELALSSSLSDEAKFKFSQRKLEYLEDFGTDAKKMQKAYDDHQKLYRSHKKRQSVSESSAAQPVAKKPKTEPTSPASGNKIMTTASRGQYSAKPTTNGAYSNSQVTASVQPQTPIQTTPQPAYPQHTAAAASGDANLYYQNYWNYQQKPEVQQYNYSQWPQYSQQYYQQ